MIPRGRSEREPGWAGWRRMGPTERGAAGVVGPVAVGAAGMVAVGGEWSPMRR